MKLLNLKIILLLALLASYVVSAKNLQRTNCNNPHYTQVQLAQCLKIRYQVIKYNLTLQYNKTLKQMISLKSLGSSAPLNPVTTLKKSKITFLKSRKDICTWVEASYASGSGAGIAALQCQIKMTEQYFNLLKDYA